MPVSYTHLVFNFEGGCYAKVINLDKDSEPDIYNAIRRDAVSYTHLDVYKRQPINWRCRRSIRSCTSERCGCGHG